MDDRIFLAEMYFKKEEGRCLGNLLKFIGGITVLVIGLAFCATLLEDQNNSNQTEQKNSDNRASLNLPDYEIFERKSSGVSKRPTIHVYIESETDPKKDKLMAISRRIVSQTIEERDVRGIHIRFSRDRDTKSKFAHVSWCPNGDWSASVDHTPGDYRNMEYDFTATTVYGNRNNPPPEAVENIPEAKRKEVYKRITYYRDKAYKKSYDKVGQDYDTEKAEEKRNEMEEKYKKLIMQKYGISEKQYKAIDAEGGEKGWEMGEFNK